MPLLVPDFHQMTKGKFDYSLQKRQPVTADASISPGNEVLELVWENGQVLMQGLFSGGRKDKSSASLLSPSPETRRREVGFGKSVAVGDAQAQVPSAEMAFSHDDDLMPWLNYPIQHEHCSDLLPEPYGVSANNRNYAPVDKRHHYNQVVMDRSCTDPSYCSSSSRLLPAHFPHLQSKASDSSGNVLSNALPVTSSSFDSNQTLPSNSSALTNFSHFSRPAALVKAHFHKHSVIGCLSAKDKTRGKNNGYNPPSQSKVVEKSCSHAVPSKAGSLVLKPKSLGDDKQSDTVCQNELSKNEENHKPRVGKNASKRMGDVEKTKTVQPSMASSVCSANAGERMPNQPVPSTKRKCHEAKESEFHSEDMEDCFEVKKAALARGGSVGRRKRVAEVHNLSERRRRDRINDRMRALQELIPNCNKVDKASMLDEAIDYLKTLQFQVQFMSMGAGMYMPSMMLPFGIQQNLSCMGHFSQPGVGIGMREMNGGSSDQPMVPMQTPHFPLSPSSLLGLGGVAVHGMVGSNLPLFGLPAQGLPMFVPPGPPPFPLPAQSDFKAVVGVNACNAGSKDQMPNNDKQSPGVS